MMRRTQILFTHSQRQWLKAESSKSGRSISELVREAVDRMYGLDQADIRRRAADSLLAAEPCPGPVTKDFDELKQELLKLREVKLP